MALMMSTISAPMRFWASTVAAPMCRGVKKMCRWHIFSLRPQRLCREDAE